MRVSASTIEDMLKGMKFPIRKEGVIDYAKKHNVSDDVLNNIMLIPDEEYNSAEELRVAIESASQEAGGGAGGKSQSFGGTGYGETGEGGPSRGGSSQGFGGRGGE